jgi:hypothetical protein
MGRGGFLDWRTIQRGADCRETAEENHSLGRYLLGVERLKKACCTELIYCIIISQIRGQCKASEVKNAVDVRRKRRNGKQISLNNMDVPARQPIQVVGIPD